MRRTSQVHRATVADSDVRPATSTWRAQKTDGEGEHHEAANCVNGYVQTTRHLNITELVTVSSCGDLLIGAVQPLRCSTASGRTCNHDWIYVDTRYRVVIPTTSKHLPTRKRANHGSRRTIPKASPFNMRSAGDDSLAVFANRQRKSRRA